MLSLQRLGGNLIHSPPIRRLLTLKLIKNNLLVVKLYDKNSYEEGNNRKGKKMRVRDLGHKRTERRVNSSTHLLFLIA